jgi:hypothetical protein
VRLLLLILVNALAFVVMPVAVNAQQTPVADPVAFEQEHFTKRCGAGTTFGDGFATQQDINNDTLTDIVINEGEITCKGEKGPDCTDEGCPYNFYVKDDQGTYIMIATARIYGYDFIKRFGNMVLAMKMHPRFCDRTDSAPCVVTVRVRDTQFTTISKK